MWHSQTRAPTWQWLHRRWWWCWWCWCCRWGGAVQSDHTGAHVPRAGHRTKPRMRTVASSTASGAAHTCICEHKFQVILPQQNLVLPFYTTKTESFIIFVTCCLLYLDFSIQKDNSLLFGGQ